MGPSFDIYSDLAFSSSLLSGTYEPYDGKAVKHPIFGSMMLVPIILATLFVIPHWLKREDITWKRILTFPLLVGQFWPQWQVLKVLKLIRERRTREWREEKEKLEKEVSSLEPFLESVPQVHIILMVVFGAKGSNTTVDPQAPLAIATFTLSVFSAAFGITKFFSVGPCRLIPYDKINLGFFLLMLNVASCLVGKGFILAFATLKELVMLTQLVSGYPCPLYRKWCLPSLHCGHPLGSEKH